MAGPNGNSIARRIGPYARAPLPMDQLSQYNPNRPDATEALWQPFYDTVAYPAAGANQLTFFQTPVGAGATPKTYEDTNMTLAGQFPAPTAFLCTAVMVLFIPGNLVAATSQVADLTALNLLDVNAVANAGYLEMNIGSKVYLRDAPIGKFPPNFSINGLEAVAQNGTAAIASTKVDFARSCGRYYEITPFLIPQNQNFNVTLNWVTKVATPSTVAGTVKTILDGFYYRQSQ